MVSTTKRCSEQPTRVDSNHESKSSEQRRRRQETQRHKEEEEAEINDSRIVMRRSDEWIKRYPTTNKTRRSDGSDVDQQHGESQHLVVVTVIEKSARSHLSSAGEAYRSARGKVHVTGVRYGEAHGWDVSQAHCLEASDQDEARECRRGRRFDSTIR